MKTEREIYDYLNDIETPYEDKKLDDIKIAKIKSTLGLEEKKKKSPWPRRLIGLAAALVLIFGGLFATDSKVLAEIVSYVEAFFTDKKVDLSQAGSMPEDVEKYTVNLHETVTLKHMSFIIEDVAIDGSYGYLNLIYPEEYAYKNKEDKLYTISNIYLNGQKISLLSVGSSPKSIGDGLVSDYMDFTLEEDLPASKDVTLGIEFSEFSDDADKAIVELNISMDRLSADNKIYLEDFQIPGLEDIKITRMTINLLNPRIEIMNSNGEIKDLSSKALIGYNSQGKKLVFARESANSSPDYEGLREVYKFVPKGNKYMDQVSDYTIEELNKLKESFSFQLYDRVYEYNIFGTQKKDQKGKVIYHDKKLGDSFIIEFK